MKRKGRKGCRLAAPTLKKGETRKEQLVRFRKPEDTLKVGENAPILLEVSESEPFNFETLKL